jgi:HSP20 family protein
MPAHSDPALEMTDMARAITRLIGEPLATAARHAIPVDLLETPDAVEVTAYLPGVRKSDVQVEFLAGVLVLRAERPLPEPAEGQLLHVESPYGRFERRLPVGRGVQAEGATATWRDGAVTIRLPKAETLRPRTIRVDAAEPPALAEPGAESAR